MLNRFDGLDLCDTRPNKIFGCRVVIDGPQITVRARPRPRLDPNLDAELKLHTAALAVHLRATPLSDADASSRR